MRMWRSVMSLGVFALVCAALITMEASRPSAGGAAGGRQDAGQAPAAGRGGQRAGGRADAPMVGPGNLVTGVWGADPMAVDSRDWGWMSKSYVSSSYKRPFYNKAKELLFSGKQVTSYTISTFDPEFYCEVRKHYGFVWFEMQHSTMSWDNIAKMIAACPGPDGAAPMIRMPDQLESSIQKATDLGAIGLIFPTMRDGNQALEAARYSRFPPFGRRSSGSGQAGTVWSGVPGGYQNTFNDNMLVVVMLETLDGILNADEIANTFGIDVVIQGNNDLIALLGMVADRPALSVAADGQPQRDAPRRQVLGQRRRTVPDRQPAESRCAVRAERTVDGRLDAAGARAREHH